MSKIIRLGLAALIAGAGSVAVLAQVAPSGRPATIRLGQQAIPGAVDSADVRVAALEKEVASLRADLKAAQNGITSLQTVQKSLFLKVSTMQPVVAKFESHSHLIDSIVTLEAHTPEGRNKLRRGDTATSIPSYRCTRKANPYGQPGYDMSWNHPWTLVWDCPVVQQ